MRVGKLTASPSQQASRQARPAKVSDKLVHRFQVRIISGSVFEPVGPCVDDWVSINVIDGSHDAVLEFLFGSHADVAQNGAGELREEALDQVEPGAVLGREGKVEAAWRPGVEPGSGFPRNVCGMIVEDQLDRGAGRIGGIEKLEEFDELAAAVALPDERVDLAGEQIDPGQQAERAMAFVLMIPREARMAAWHWRQIRCRRGDGLDSRLLVVR